MIKIQVTAQQRANAIEARDVMWPSVPPDNVFPGLLEVRYNEPSEHSPNCGSVACFSGWATHWPAFKIQLRGRPGYDLDVISETLFGYQGMWVPRPSLSEVDEPWIVPSDIGFKGTDHALVTRRLNWLIENSEVVS